MTPATPATTHASRAAAHMLHAADAAGQPSSGAGPQFAELLQAQRAPQPPVQTQQPPQPAARSSAPAARAQQPNSTASRDERSAADRAAERQAARREQPVGKQPSNSAAAAPAPTAATPAAQQEAAAVRRAADGEDQAAAPAQDEAATTPTATDTEAAAQTAQAGEADDAAQPVDWLATLGLAPLAPAPALPPTLRGAANTAADALPAASGVAAAPGKLPMGDAATAAMTAQDTPAPALDAGATAADALAALAAAPAPALVPASAAAESPRGFDATLQPALHLPGLAAAAGGGSAAAAPVTAQIATPLHAPDFGQALAAQLTTFARDGVQEATLQLNPAEMGPIDVKIVVEGQQAQIDFSAAQAATRQALQDGLPGLAAALHAGGLTLAGGGVFEQRQPSRDPAQAAPGRAGGPRERGVGGVEATGRPAALPAARGLLDLYA